jgi:hypothetical protein
LLASSMVSLAVGLGAASEDGELVLLVGKDRIKAVGERAHLYAMLHSHLVVELKRQKMRSLLYSSVTCYVTFPGRLRS